MEPTPACRRMGTVWEKHRSIHRDRRNVSFARWIIYHIDKQGGKNSCRKYYHHLKRYWRKDCYINPSKAFQIQTEITLDMTPNMEQTARISFPVARLVRDRFHVQKLAYEAVQDMRVNSRWEAFDEESVHIAHTKACRKTYHIPVFENGDSRKQLLPRSIYLQYKKESL